MVIPNLLIISGTGKKAGKTTIACRIIEQFQNLHVVSMKISPHFHEASQGLKALMAEGGYAIYEETDSNTMKDTSRMLKSGASKVFFGSAWNYPLADVFLKIMEEIPAGTPVICESPSLRNYIEPGLFIIISSNNKLKHKDIKQLQELPNLTVKLEDLADMDHLPIQFRNGRWDKT